MSKQSKTARASAVKDQTEKKAISDEQYIKNLRNDVASGLHVTQEGAKALLRAYDALLAKQNLPPLIQHFAGLGALAQEVMEKGEDKEAFLNGKD